MFTVGFIVTVFHDDKYRKYGKEYFKNYINSINENIKYDFKIFAMDNGSSIPFHPKNDEYIVKRFDNNRKTGLSRTWNVGCEMAYNSGCDIMVVSNDDVEFTETINDLIVYCFSNEDKKNCFIGPVSNPEGVSTPHQRRDGPGDNILDYTNVPWNGRSGYALNGFCQSFHRSFYEKFNSNGKLWNLDDTKPIFGGEEEDLFDRCTPLGMRSIVFEPWYVYHEKLTGPHQYDGRPMDRDPNRPPRNYNK